MEDGPLSLHNSVEHFGHAMYALYSKFYLSTISYHNKYQ